MGALTSFGRLPWVATISGAGPFTLINNAVNRYDDTAADAFTMNMPPTPTDGDEVWVLEIGGSQNPVTLSGNGNNVTEWSTIDTIVGSIELAMATLIVGYKFLEAFGTWARINSQVDGEWTPRNSVTTATTLSTNQITKYGGSFTFQIDLHPTPVKGEINGVSENAGSGAGTLTISAGINTLVNDAGAAVTSMTLSTAYASRRWRWDTQVNIWLMIARAP